jgi:hypothetical protein
MLQRKIMKILGLASLTPSLIFAIGYVSPAFAGSEGVTPAGESSSTGAANFYNPTPFNLGPGSSIMSTDEAINNGTILELQANRGVGFGGSIITLNPNTINLIMTVAQGEINGLLENPESFGYNLSSAQIASLRLIELNLRIKTGLGEESQIAMTVIDQAAIGLDHITVTSGAGVEVTIGDLLSNLYTALSNGTTATNATTAIPTALNDAAVGLRIALKNPANQDNPSLIRASQAVIALLEMVKNS